MAYQQHQQTAQAILPRCGVVTLSDTRTPETDVSGQLIQKLLAADGAHIGAYELLKDDPSALGALLDGWLARDDIDAVLSTGGTGIARRDATINVVERIIETPLPGFGELFRTLSFQQIGAGAMLSRAAGGVARGKLIFAMPGSSGAVELAMTRLILPEIRHLLAELRR